MELLGYNMTKDISNEAFKNDKDELITAFNPKYVTITQEKTPAGCLALFKVIVNAPTYILTCEEDTTPKPAQKLVFFIKVFNDYPAIAPKVYFASNCRLAHVNTFRNGTQCIDAWGKYSSLKSIAEKTIRAIIHDENVTKYNSPACSALESWQKSMVAKKAFPSLTPPDLILAENAELVSEAPALPPPLPGVRPRVEPMRVPTPPPLPGRS